MVLLVHSQCTGQFFSLSVSCFWFMGLICFEVWCNFSFELKPALLELNHDIVSAGALDVE